MDAKDECPENAGARAGTSQPNYETLGVRLLTTLRGRPVDAQTTLLAILPEEADPATVSSRAAENADAQKTVENRRSIQHQGE